MVEWTMVSDGSFWGFWCSGCTSSFQHKAPERDTKPKGRNRDAGVSRLTRYTLYTLHTHYAHSAHTQYSHCTLSAHTLRTHCKHTTLTLHTHCTLTAHTLHSLCTHTALILYTLHSHCKNYSFYLRRIQVPWKVQCPHLQAVLWNCSFFFFSLMTTATDWCITATYSYDVLGGGG